MGRLNIRGCGVCRGSVDNRGMVDSVSHWVGNKSRVGKGVGNKSMVGYWVSNHSMVGCAMGDNSTMSMDNLVGRHSRGRGGGSKAKKSGNNESLHFCSILVLQLPC